MSVPSGNARRLVFIALGIGMMIGAMGTGIASAILGSALFRDVKVGSPYDAAIGEMVNLSVMEGISRTQFKPEGVVKRGELALILKRFRDSLNGVTPEPPASPSAAASVQQSSTAPASVSSSSVASSLAYNPAGYIRFTTQVFNVNESLGAATITIVRTGGNQGTVSVDYVLLPGSAVAGRDYVDSTGTLTFANKETSKKLQIQVKDDGIAVPVRELTVELKNPKNAGGVAPPSRATLRILDRFSQTVTEDQSVPAVAFPSSSAPTTPVINFSTTAYATTEDAGSVSISVVRSGVTTVATDVRYTTTNGTATLNDHSPTGGTLSFAANETSKAFSVAVSDDAGLDGNRAVNLFLSNPTNGGVIGTPGAAVLNIFDNETMSFGSGSLRFNKAKYEVGEGAKFITITVMRAGGAKGTATVNFATAGGSATEGTDYRGTSGTLTFAPGEAARTFDIAVVKDSISDGGETINLTLSNAMGATLGDPTLATVTLFE